MGDGGHRYVGAFLLLVLVWIGVFWWWEPAGREPVTFEPPVAIVGDDVQALPTVDSTVSPADENSLAAPGRLVMQGGSQSDGANQTSFQTPTVDGAGSPDTAGGEASADGVAAGGVIAPTFREVVIRLGDTYASIARRELGSSSLAGTIARANPLKDPRRLRVGETLRVPTDPTNIQGKPIGDEGEAAAASPMIEYTVQRGDTLGGIARRFYGSSRFADVIFEANRDRMRSMDTVRLGQVLMIPPASQVTGAN